MLDDLAHQLCEELAFGLAQRVQHLLLGLQHGRACIGQQGLALGRQGQQTHASILGRVLAQQQAACFQAVDHAADGGFVKAHFHAQRALVYARQMHQFLQHGKLQRRHAPGFRGLAEHGHGHLLQAAYAVAGKGFHLQAWKEGGAAGAV